MIDLVKLETFIVAAETLNFSEAAKQLKLAQPTISYQIKNLEKDLGARLFSRSGSQLQITEAGRLLLPWARKMVRDSHELREVMAGLQEGISGSLRIACSTTAGKYILPQFAARFSQYNPSIQVSILRCTSEDVVPRLLEGDAHLGVLSSEIQGDDLDIQAFFDDYITLIAPANHPWAIKAHIQPEDLLQEPVILREPTSGTRRVMMTELAKHDIREEDLNVFLELGNAEAIVRMVAAGYGVSFVSTLASACPMQRGNVINVTVEGLSLRRTIYMVRKHFSTPHRPQEAFWSFIHHPANRDLLQMAEHH